MITIRATHTFYLGPRHANGAREIAVHKGDVRTIPDPGPGGAFWTTTRFGARFGLCHLGRGWEVVGSGRAAGRRGPKVSRETAHELGPKDESIFSSTHADELDAMSLGPLSTHARAHARIHVARVGNRAGRGGRGFEDDDEFWPL